MRNAGQIPSPGMNDTTSPSSQDPLAAYVEALLVCTGTLMRIVDHMLAYDAARGGPHPEAEPIPDTLRRLISQTLAPDFAGGDELAAAAALIERTTDRICDEIYLVPPEPLPEACAGGRRRGRRA